MVAHVHHNPECQSPGVIQLRRRSRRNTGDRGSRRDGRRVAFRLQIASVCEGLFLNPVVFKKVCSRVYRRITATVNTLMRVKAFLCVCVCECVMHLSVWCSH